MVHSNRYLAFLLGLVLVTVACLDTASANDGTAPSQPQNAQRYITETHGQFNWTFPNAQRDVAEPMFDEAPVAWQRIAEDLGVPVTSALDVIIARNPQEMAELSPAVPPKYAVGVAFPDAGVIALTLAVPGSATPPDIDTTLEHELSHIALHRAVDGHRVPRWFAEGLAIYHSEEHGIARMQTMLRAAIGNSTVPLKELSRRFPANEFEVGVAYAQSADIVATMRRYDEDGTRFKKLIEHLRAGNDFESSLAESFGWNLLGLEQHWRQNMRTRYRIAPLLFGGTTIWTFAAFILLLAYRRRKKEHAEKLEQLAEQERREEPEGNVDAFVAIFPSGMDDQSTAIMRTDSTIPVVEHDGENHTLH